MTNLNKTLVLSARIEFFGRKFRTPLRLSSGLIETITEARATVRVKVGKREAEGRGSIYLSGLWAWPSSALTHQEKDSALRKKSEEVAVSLPVLAGEPAHPLEIGLRLHDGICAEPNAMPPLATALCIAPFDAAIHDAAGQALGESAFSFYRAPVPIPSADAYFADGACRAIAQSLRQPVDALDGWWLVNAHDDLEGVFAEAIQKRGFRCFKIKILGKETSADVRHTVSVYQAARRHGVSSPRLSLDSNEAHASADTVLEYLRELKDADPSAFTAVTYLEQPTNRDICQHGFDWREVAGYKPVLLDEGLTSLDLLPRALAQGWSGLALKTCKGHSFSLVAAAWAHQHGLLLAMQDLTNPGLAAIHSWLFAAHLPVINGVELNSPQFTPQANDPWLPRLSTLFDVRDGKHRMAFGALGLGSNL